MVKQGLPEMPIPIPKEKLLGFIKQTIEEDKKMETAEKLLYQWLHNQPFFPNDYDKNITRNFLRGSKFDVERTKKVLQQHYAARPLYPDIFAERFPASCYLTDARKVLNIGAVPCYSSEGYRTFIFRFKESDENSMVAATKFFFAFYDSLMKSPYPIVGETCILDVRALSTSFLLRAYPHIKKTIFLLRKAYAVRLKKIHMLVNPLSGIERLLALLRPFLHHKVRDNIFVHDDCSKLQDHFTKDMLPSTYGGTYQSMEDQEEKWENFITENAKWLDEHHKDIKLKLPTKDQLLYFKDDMGVNGCFRKIEID